MANKIFEAKHDELFGEYTHMIEKPHRYSDEDHHSMKKEIHKKFGALGARHFHNAAVHYVEGDRTKAMNAYSRFERHIKNMKGSKSVKEAHVMQVKGEAGHQYHKWGDNGGVESWKNHVKKHHKTAVFTNHGTGEFVETHATSGDKKLGRYSHYNHSSKTLVGEAYTPSKSLEGRTKYIVQPQLSQMLKDRLEARKKKGKKKGYTPSAGTLGLAAARKAQMSGSKKKVSEETLIEVKKPKKVKDIKRKYLGTLKGRTATGKKAHAIDVKPTVDLKSKV